MTIHCPYCLSEDIWLAEDRDCPDQLSYVCNDCTDRFEQDEVFIREDTQEEPA